MLERLKQTCRPQVHYHALYVLAGLMWTGVGIMLLWRAGVWLRNMKPTTALLVILVSVLLTALFYSLMFRKTVRKNIARLTGLPERVCVLAFNSAKGYVMIVFMIALGITLRRSSIPRPYLAVVYATMGATLLISSFHFYHHFWQERRGKSS
ncbi:MAG: hypothetical protein GXO55_10340 [Chloroflexi bacterium]|nr:hypothetical protein [Chloroflexota bacterium]